VDNSVDIFESLIKGDITPKMTTPALTAVETARALFEALQKRDVDAVLALDTDDAVGDVVAIGAFRGKTAIRRFLDEMFAAFPDFDLVVDHVFGDDDSAVVQWHATGTFSGAPFQRIEPTGKRVEIRGVDVVDIVAGRIVRDTMFYDGASLARQIGMLPQSGSGTEKALLSVFNALTRVRQRRR
jgi:steroid delta-isomerase-like uncharacterized protein